MQIPGDDDRVGGSAVIEEARDAVAAVAVVVPAHDVPVRAGLVVEHTDLVAYHIPARPGGVEGVVQPVFLLVAEHLVPNVGVEGVFFFGVAFGLGVGGSPRYWRVSSITNRARSPYSM